MNASASQVAIIGNVSPCHQVLYNYDLLWEMFTRFRAEGRSNFWRLNLLSCALVSHTFSQAALRVLWNQLRTLDPFWCLLAPLGISRKEIREAPEFSLPKILEARLWQDPQRLSRLQQYASYLVHLDTCLLRAPTVRWGEAILRSVRDHIGGSPIFPKLRSLVIVPTPFDPPVDLLAPLCCPSLNYLRIIAHRDSPNTDYEAVLSHIRTTAMDLEALIIEVSLPPSARLAEDIVRCPRLRTVRIMRYITSLDELHTLVTKPDLSNLYMFFELEESSALVAQQDPEKDSSLRTLELLCSSSDLGRLLSITHFPMLTSAKFNIFDHTASSIHHYSCTESIARALSPVVLRDLQITFTERHSTEHPSSPVSLSSLLLPLFRIHSLDKLVLRFGSTERLSATDDVFADIAKHWSALRTLRLDFRSWHKHGQIPTASALVSLARGCPHLHELVLPYLDPRVPTEGDAAASDSASTPTLLDPRAFPHPLRRLFIADDRRRGPASTAPAPMQPSDTQSAQQAAPSAPPEQLAEMIHRLFPRLDIKWRAYIRDPNGHWTKVFDVLRTPRRGVGTV